jgi:hypothetical protein
MAMSTRTVAVAALTGAVVALAGAAPALAANGPLMVTGTAGTRQLPDAVRSGTSPAIATQPDNGYVVAFQGADTFLHVDGTAGLGTPGGAQYSGAAEFAYEPAAGTLAVEGGAGRADSGEAVALGSRPSIAGIIGGGYEVAFRGTDGDVWLYGTLPGVGGDTHRAVAAGTSPSIAATTSGGYEIAYVAPASSPLGTPHSPVTTMVPLPASHRHGQLRVAIKLKWTWLHRHTTLDRIIVRRVPPGARIRVQCRGGGCGQPRTHSVVGRHVARLIAALRGRIYQAGDRLFIRVSGRGDTEQRAEVTIRDGRKPFARALPVPHSHRTTDRRRRHRGGTDGR